MAKNRRELDITVQGRTIKWHRILEGGFLLFLFYFILFFWLIRILEKLEHLTAFPNFCTVWKVNSNFYLLTTHFFHIHFSSDFLSHPLFYLNIISSFIFYSFFYYHLFFSYSFPTIIFFNKKMLYSQYFSQYFHKNHIKILCEKLLLILIWTHF